MKLYQHQKAGIEHMVRNCRGAANFSETGCGKTAMAIVAMFRLAKLVNLRRVLVLCPNSLKFNWEKEIKMWGDSSTLNRDWSTVVMDGAKRVKDKAYSNWIKTNGKKALILNYDSVSKYYELFNVNGGFDLVICDEMHMIKSRTAKRTKAVKKIKTKYKFGLTGTPEPQGALDIWSQLDWLQPGLLSQNYYSFEAEYFHRYDIEKKDGTKFRTLKVKKSMLPKLSEKKAQVGYTATKDEALDLPSVTETVIPIKLQPKARKAYDQLADYMVSQIDGELISATNVLTQLLRFQQIAGGFTTTDEGKSLSVGTEKIETLRDLLDQIPDRKAIVWARFKNEIELIQSMLAKAARPYHTIAGWVPPEERDAAVADFQHPDDRNTVMIVNPQCGGTGLTLTEAASTFYYSQTFSYGDFKQTRDRNHRIGQNKKVDYFYLTCMDTVDEYILETIRNKESIANTLTTKDFIRAIHGGKNEKN